MSAPETIGTSPLRLEALAKVTGKARYAGDHYPPGLLQARAVRSPYPHARILDIDCSRALALEGVVAVLTAADLPDRLWGLKVQDMPILARGVVRFAGERVALVAAVDAETAAAGVDLVTVTYEPLPALLDVEAAAAAAAPPVHPDLDTYAGVQRDHRGGPNAYWREVEEHGNVEAGLQAAELVVTETFTTASQSQGYMEPRNCQVQVGDDGRVTMWSSCKVPFKLRDLMAQYTGLPPEMITVINTPIGGDFGGKNGFLAEPACYYLALKTGRPVRFANTRFEEFQAGTPRHASRITIRAGVTRDGRLTAWDVRMLFDTGAYAAYLPRPGLHGVHHFTGGYRCPHVRMESQQVYTNRLHHGHMRAPGSPQVSFACESMMDILAERLGLDPLEFRLQNAVGRDDPSALGTPWRDNHLQETLALAAEQGQWHELRATPRRSPSGLPMGIGIACCERPSGAGHSSAVVRAESDGSVTILTGTVDVGTASPTLFRQVTAATLGLPLDRVRVQALDTDTAPVDQGAGGSRYTPVAAEAVRLAALDLVEAARSAAQDLLECPADLLEYAGGTFRIREVPGRQLTLADLSRSAAGRGSPLTGNARIERKNPPETCFTAAVAEVEVDPATGIVRLLRILSVHDIGKVLHPASLRGQIEGGVLQAVGFTLSENLHESGDGTSGAVTFGDYGVLNPADAPEIVTAVLEGAASPGPFGAKSIGEAMVMAISPAIASAIHHATGVRLQSLPVSSGELRARLG